jgi:hypothetical protein
MCVIVWTDDWRDPAVHRQSERACGGSEGSGGAGSSCEPSQGGFVGDVFGGGSVYPLEGLWFVFVSVVVGAWYWRVNDVRAWRCVRTRGCVGGCVCGVRGDDGEDEEGDDEGW